MIKLENQDTEFKKVWKDEYLAWICAFANTNGGILYIGIDDDGKVVGVDNVRKLLKDITNKIKSTLDILPMVEAKQKDNLYYIVITVFKYPSVVSYQGRIYVRSGSNTLELTGLELERFLLMNHGMKWENKLVMNASLDDISLEAIKYFKDKAISKGRLSEDDLNLPIDKLLENLELYNGKYLNYAGVLLFSENPEKWVLNSIVKIGFFANNHADLIFQDEVGGPLILQVDKVMNLVYDKYLKALIRYEGIQRIEEFIFPYDAFRELLLNSIIHKSYETRNTIQISIYEDKIYS